MRVADIRGNYGAGCGRQLTQRDSLWNARRRLHRNDDFESPLVVGQGIDERASRFALGQSRVRQQLARGPSLRAKLLDEVVAIRHEWPHRDCRVRPGTLDDLGHLSSGRSAQLNERCVKCALLARIALVYFLRQLHQRCFRAAAVLRRDNVGDVSERQVHLARVRTSRPSATWSLL
jgi:hypothetical protein